MPFEDGSGVQVNIDPASSRLQFLERFEAWDGSNYPEIFTMDVNGSNRKQLTNQTGAFWNSGPIYNPSGTRMYFLKGFNADSPEHCCGTLG